MINTLLYDHSVPLVSCCKALHDHPSTTTISLTLYLSILSFKLFCSSHIDHLVLLKHSQHASNMESSHVLLFVEYTLSHDIQMAYCLTSFRSLLKFILLERPLLISYIKQKYLCLACPTPTYYFLSLQDFPPPQLLNIYLCLFIVYCPQPQVECRLHEGTEFVLLTHVSSLLSIVPGTHQPHSKYVLNK